MAELQNFSSLYKKLNSIEPKISKRIQRHGLRAAAKLVRTELRAGTPVLTGELQKSYKLKSGKRRKNTISIQVVSDLKYSAARELGAYDRIGLHNYEKCEINKKGEMGQIFIDDCKSELRKL